MTSRTACEELCLLETAFPCASAEYFQSDQECRLSRESRRQRNCSVVERLLMFFRSQPSSYRATTQDVDYLENQCARERRPGNCEYDEYSGQDLGFADIQMTTRSQELCGEQCDQTSAFNCRSYSYFPSTGVSGGRDIIKNIFENSGLPPLWRRHSVSIAGSSDRESGSSLLPASPLR